MNSDDALTIHRLSRELDFYKRQVNQAGAETIKAREELSQAVRETMRSRVMLKLVREVYRLGDFGGAETDVEHVVLHLIMENAMCDRAMLLGVTPDPEGHRFRVLSALGCDPDKSVGFELTMRRPHRYCYTTGDSKREGQTADLCTLIGLPYILWSYDPGGGLAILLGNHRESNAHQPFDQADQELVETALSVYLDILHRKRENRRLENALATIAQDDDASEAGDQAGSTASDIGGIEQAEIQARMKEGGRLTGFLVVDRTSHDGPEFVAYIRGSWSPGYRLLRSFRGRSVRAFKDVSRLLHVARYTFKYLPPIVVYAAGAPELKRFPGIWPTDLSPLGNGGAAFRMQMLSNPVSA